MRWNTLSAIRIIAALLAIVLLAGCVAIPADTNPAAHPTPTADSGLEVTVVEVVDGDTIDIRYANGTEARVRLLGIDTPEVHAENTPDEFEGIPETGAGRACLRAKGHDATAYANATLLHEEVRLVYDPLADRRGSYGRLLGYIYLDGKNFNYRLLAEGYARVYDSRFAESDRFYDAEATAQSENRGLWRCTDPSTADSETATGDGDLVVAEIHADATGNDNENLNDEYVVLENRGNESLDLSGWAIADEADHEYSIPDGFVLEPEAQVTVYSGSGSDSGTALYWGRDSAVWNNGGDTVFVVNGGGEVRVEQGY